MKISVSDLRKIVLEELQGVVTEDALLREGSVPPGWTLVDDPENRGRTCYNTKNGLRCSPSPAEEVRRKEKDHSWYEWYDNWVGGGDEDPAIAHVADSHWIDKKANRWLSGGDHSGRVLDMPGAGGSIAPGVAAPWVDRKPHTDIESTGPAKEEEKRRRLRADAGLTAEPNVVGPVDDSGGGGGGRGGGGRGGGGGTPTPPTPGPPTDPGGDVVEPKEEEVIWHVYRDDKGRTIFVNTETKEEQLDCPEHIDCEAAEAQLTTLYPEAADEDEDGEGEEPVEEPVEERLVCQNPDILNDAYEMYEALEGWGTDEDAIYEILHNNSEPECVLALYQAFEDVLERMKDTDDGDLVAWLKDDGEDASAKYVLDTLTKMIKRR